MELSQDKLKIIITGSSGFVGTALVPFLKSKGHSVLSLNRIGFEKQIKDAEGFDAIIHLAGENITSKRWTQKRKNELIDSRVNLTHEIIAFLKKLKKPPKTFICASGIGIFGNRPGEICDENSLPGKGFLADLAQKWEQATQEAKNLGMRVVTVRFAGILSSSGGLLKQMLTPYKFFLGGPLGDGHQRMPWVSLQDVLSIILFALTHPKIEGPINVVAPEIITNAEFSQKLAKVLHRPHFFRMPAVIVNIIFGQMGRELFLYDIGAIPKKLQDAHYEFIHPHLDDALTYYLK